MQIVLRENNSSYFENKAIFQMAHSRQWVFLIILSALRPYERVLYCFYTTVYITFERTNLDWDHKIPFFFHQNDKEYGRLKPVQKIATSNLDW